MSCGKEASLPVLSWISEEMHASITESYTLQRVLLRLNSTNYEAIAAPLLEESREITLEFYRDFMNQLQMKINSHPQRCVIEVALLMQTLFASEKNTGWKKYMGTFLSDMMRTSYHINANSATLHVMIIRRMYLMHVYSADDVINTIVRLLVRLPVTGSNEMMMRICLIFSPEISTHAPELYETFIETIGKVTPGSLSPAVIFILRKYIKLKENNFQLLQEYINYGHEARSIEVAIRYDDIEALKMFMAKPGFDPNQRVSITLFENTALHMEPTLIEYAAYYGAHRSFKLLVGMGALKEFLTAGTTFRNRLTEFAIAGGNMTIIQILHSMKFQFGNELPYSVSNFQNNIFFWFYSRQSAEGKVNMNRILNEAVMYGNIRMIMFCLAQKLDINEKDDQGMTALHHACANNQLVVAKLLLKHPNIKPDQRSKTCMTPLGLCAACGFPYIVELFLEKEGIDVNVKDSEGLSSLHRAVQKNFLSTIKVLLRFPNIDVNIHDQFVCFLFIDQLLYTLLRNLVSQTLLECFWHILR